MRHCLRAIALVCGALIAACRGHVAAPVAPGTGLSPDAVYAAVRRQESQVRALRSRFSARVSRAGEVRRADGVLLVKKPDRFRLRLLLPFGPTVFDYTSWDAHDRMQLPLEGKQFNDAEIAGHAPFSPADLRAVFLGTDGRLECSAQGGATETIVECRDPAGAVTRLIRVQTATRRVAQEVHLVADQPELIMQFDDYRQVDSVDLPFQISLTYPQKNVRLEITVRSYDVNPTLADELFNALQPSHSRS
jgi:outer membrane lipoprotein-sorting protein